MIPSIQSVSVEHRVIRSKPVPFVNGGEVVIASTVTDAGSTPTTRIRAGQVLVKKTATGKFYPANDASDGDRDTAPSITSSGHADGNGVICIVGNHGTISVTTATGTGTEANNATDLNADGAFKAHYVATSGGGELTIAARATGPEEWFYVATGTRDAAGFAEGIDNKVQGTGADYRVTLDPVDMLNNAGSAADQSVATALVGCFKESNLVDLTGEAKACFLRRGSVFE